MPISNKSSYSYAPIWSGWVTYERTLSRIKFVIVGCGCCGCLQTKFRFSVSSTLGAPLTASKETWDVVLETISVGPASWIKQYYNFPRKRERRTCDFNVTFSKSMTFCLVACTARVPANTGFVSYIASVNSLTANSFAGGKNWDKIWNMNS